MKKILHKALISFLAVCLVLPMTGSMTGAVDVPISSVTTSGSTSYWYPTQGNVYAASTLGLMAARWDPDFEAWRYIFRITGAGEARWNGGSSANLIRLAVADIKTTYNKSNIMLSTINNAKYIGSAPATSGSQPDYYDVAYNVVSLVITAVNNIYLGFAWTTLGLLGAFHSTNSGYIDNSSRVYREWYWGSDKADVGQYLEFIVYVEPYQECEFSAEYYILGPGYDLLQIGTFIVNCPPNPAMRGNPGGMSESERALCGIVAVSREDLPARAVEFGMTEDELGECLESDASEFYFALSSNLNIEIVPAGVALELNCSSVTKEDLAANIAYQIDRSEKIVLAISTCAEAADDPENIAMLEKHEERIKLLTILQDELEGVNSNNRTNTQSLSDIYNAYSSIMGN